MQNDTVKFCVALAHGTVHFYEFNINQKDLIWIHQALPYDRSLLYCCHLFTNENLKEPEKIFLCGGSVQNAILIWEIDFHGTSVQLSRLLGGHKGAIFGLHISWNDSVLVSVGDDRTVIMWKAVGGLSNTQNSLEGVQWELLNRFTGHDARIWGGLKVPGKNLVLAWGEDCTVRFWKADSSNLCGSLTPHCGRSIWTADIRALVDRLIIVTGGNDGAIVISEFPFEGEQQSINCLSITDRHDFPRRVLLLNSGQLLVMTDLGRIYTTPTVEDVKPSSLTGLAYNDIDETLLASYCCWSTIDDEVFLGNIQGNLMVVKIMETNGTVTGLKLIQTLCLGQKVMLIGQGIVSGSLMVSLSNGQIISLSRSVDGIFYIDNIEIAIEDSWVSCWASWSTGEGKLLVCGDRNGKLYLFSTVYTNDEQPKQIAVFSHSIITTKKGGITCILWDTHCERLFVGNKLGEVWSMSDQLTELSVVLKNTAILGWVCRIESSGLDGLLITGFKSSMFRRVSVRYDGTQPVVVLEQPCGGGHRDWDYLHLSTFSRFAFIQTRSVQSVTWGSRCNEPVVLKPHLHGKEINFCSFLISEGNQMTVLTGSEDCSLALIRLTKQKEQANEVISELHVDGIHRLHGHISSVRCATRIGQSLIATAGGRGQIIFWRTSPRYPYSMSIVTSALLPRLLGSLTDVRIMDMCSVCFDKGTEDSLQNLAMTALACSNGFLVFVSLATLASRPKLELQSRISMSCLTGVSFVQSVLVSSSTDGRIYWVPFTGQIGCIRSQQMSKCALHGMDVVASRDGVISICAGGDDGRIVVLFLQRKDSHWDIKNLSQSSLAHTGGTVSTRWIPDHNSVRPISLGADGRLLLWNFIDANNQFELCIVKCINVGVTDPHDVSVMRDPVEKNRYWFYIVGMGARLFPLNLICDE